MLLIFGTSELLLNYFENDNSNCPNCNNSTLTFRVVQQYYHVYGLPISPTGKYTGVSCDSCTYTSNNVMSDNSKYYELQTKAPMYLYTGAALFFLIIFGIIFLIFN